MEEATESAQLWSWSEKAIASLYWSDALACWRWGITRQKAGKWELWKSGRTNTCASACYSMAQAFEALGQDEGEPF